MSKILLKIFQYFLTSLCFYYIFIIINEEKKYKDVLLGFEFYKLLPGIIFSILIVLTYSILILNILRENTSIKINDNSWRNIFIKSQFYNVIPFAGFVYRGIALKKYNLDFKKYTYSYFLIVWLWAIFSLTLFFFELGFYAVFSKSKEIFFIAVILLFVSFFSFISIFIASWLLNLIKSKNIIFKNNFFINLNRLLIFFKNSINKKNLVAFSSLSIIIHIFEILVYFSVANLLNLDLSFAMIFLIFIINVIIDFIPLTPQNLGIAELASGTLLTIIGSSFSLGVLIRLFVRLCSLLSILILFVLINLKNSEKL